VAFILTPKQAAIRDRIGGPAKHILLYGGSRSGKTALFCYALAVRALAAPGSRHGIFRLHGVDVKQSIALDTMPKVLAAAWPDTKVADWKEQDGYFKFGNGSEIWLAGLDDKARVEKVLGKEFATLYLNEASQIPYGSYLVAQTRLAQQVAKVDGTILRLKTFQDLNPTTRNHWTYRLWRDGVDPEDESPVNRDWYTWDQVNPLDNAANLPEDYIESLRALPERQRKRFFEGEYSGDDENALWRREMFKRVTKDDKGEWPVAMRRIVVAIDPAASNTPGSDETGIVVCARGADGNGYVLEDGSGRYRPEEWAKQAVALYRSHGADRIIGEVNQGGDMVEAVIRAHARDVPFMAVRASRGKVTRAEPVAALYERGKVFHAEGLRALEEQCCTFTADFDRKAQGWSPDRVDALVWGFTDLFASLTRKGDGKPIKYGSLANVA
jgi:predicted phage terminase large subunit-like protein